MSAASDALNAARAAARAAFAQFGGAFLEPAILQPAHTYLELSGEELRARLVVTASANGGDELCLRPDLTVAAALEKLARDEAAPGAVLYDGPAFRQPLSAADRPIEFPQTGREKFGGTDAAQDDAEALKAALAACQACGVTGVQISLSDASLARAIIEAAGFKGSEAVRAAALLRRKEETKSQSRSALGQALSGLSLDAAESAVREIVAASGADLIGGRSARDIAERLLARAAPQPNAPEPVRQAAADIFAIAAAPAKAIAAIEARADKAGLSLKAWADSWRARIAAMEKAGVDLSAARFNAGREFRFGYYDGFVFELFAPSLGEAAPLSAGGRYDGLLAALSNGRVSLPAVGAMVRADRLARAKGGQA
jgi:ATP phosphoribosyltransferase regulatory subunit